MNESIHFDRNHVQLTVDLLFIFGWNNQQVKRMICFRDIDTLYQPSSLYPLEVYNLLLNKEVIF